MRKPKNQLLRSLNRPILQEEQAQQDMSRRDFLSTSLKAGAFLGISTLLPKFAMAESLKPRIAIVGAGIAGLNAAWHLRKSGLHADIFEASNRTGGRMMTARDKMGYNLTTEVGGEFIDSNHYDMFGLVKEFGLKLKDNWKDPLAKDEIKETFHVNGVKYTYEDIVKEYEHFRPRVKADKEKLGENYDTPFAQQMDKLSIEEYFDLIGITGWLREVLSIAFISEYGLEVDDQSAINFLDTISVEKKFAMYDESDERYNVVGGNDMVTRKLTEKLHERIYTGHKLAALRMRAGKYQLSFDNGKEATYDIVIMTIPFTVLVDVEMHVDLPQSRIDAIEQLGYGYNSKLIMGFDKRIWRDHNTCGYLYDKKIHNGWDSTIMQTDNKGMGSYTCYTGGDAAIRMAKMAKQKDQLVSEYLRSMNNVFDGAYDQFNGKVIVADWPQQPFVKGSYAAFRVGQWMPFYGKLMEPVGNLHFAGEHCSEESQGFMNGGAETGRRAAQAVIRKMKGKHVAHK